jgi:DnaJ-domain-containing protein 1
MNEFGQSEESNPSLAEGAEISGSAELAAERHGLLFDRAGNLANIPSFQEELQLPNPEEVLHKVVEAAEQNQAIEKMLERSHEIKDSDGYQRLATGPTALGELIRAHTESLVGVQQPSQIRQTDKQAGRLHKILHDNSLYGHAIRYGFVTALCSLLVALLAVWLFT